MKVRAYYFCHCYHDLEVVEGKEVPKTCPKHGDGFERADILESDEEEQAPSEEAPPEETPLETPSSDSVEETSEEVDTPEEEPAGEATKVS